MGDRVDATTLRSIMKSIPAGRTYDGARKTLWAIWSYCLNGKDAFPSRRELCEVCGFTDDSSVSDAIRRLKELGLLEAQKKSFRGVNTYTILAPEQLLAVSNNCPQAMPIVAPEQCVKKRERKEEYALEFEKLWKAYPKQQGKLDAFSEYQKVTKSGVEPATLISAAISYATNVKDTEPKFIKLLKNWLRDRRWEDAVSSPQQEEYL